MNSVANIVTTMRNHANIIRPVSCAPLLPKGRSVRTLRAWSLTLAVLALTACATQRTHPPAVAQVPAKPAMKSDISAAPAVASLEQRNHEQDKNRTKSDLAKNTQDSLGSLEVGYYMDVLQGRLKQVAGKSIDIGRQGDRIVLALAFQSIFESGSAQISQSIRALLTSLTGVLVEYRKTSVSVRARVADTGASMPGPLLAEQRKLAVARYLASVGVAGKRIVIAKSSVGQTPASSDGAQTGAFIELQIEPIVRRTAHAERQ